jgi:hypothetical protein
MQSRGSSRVTTIIRPPADTNLLQITAAGRRLIIFTRPEPSECEVLKKRDAKYRVSTLKTF